MLENIPLSEVSDIFDLAKHLALISLLELNSRVYVYEDDTWAIKGRYEDALEDNDDVVWMFDDGQDKLYLLIVS